MAQIPRWLLGRNTAFAITPLFVDATGTLNVVDTTYSMVGTLDDVSPEFNVSHEDISPMDIRTAHNVIIEDDSAISLTEILKTNSINILARFVSYADYAFIVFARGSQTYQGYYVRGNYGEDNRKNKSVGRLQLRRVNIIGQGNPQYLATGDPVFPGGPTLAYLLGA